MIKDLRERVDQLETQVDKVVAKINMAIGGMIVLSSVALLNLAVNIVQATTGVKP